MQRVLILFSLVTLSAASTEAEEFRFFLIPQSCWDNILAGQFTLDCVIRTSVQGINLLNFLVAFYYRVPQIKTLLQTKSTVGLS